MSGSTVKKHRSLRKLTGYNATRKNSFLLWFQACQVLPRHLHQLQGHLWDRRVILHHLLHPHLLHLPVGRFVRFEKEKMWLIVTSLQCQCLNLLMIAQGDLMKPKPTKIPKPNKKETTMERGDPLCSDDSEIPEWLQEFRGEFGGWWNSITGRLSRQFISWSLFRADRKETWGFG